MSFCVKFHGVDRAATALSALTKSAQMQAGSVADCCW
jgi:hypothetical protein